MLQYSNKLLDHFKNPRNYGKMKNPSGVGKVGNIVCGDLLEFYIKVQDNKVIDAKFMTFGCVAALGVSSVLTEIVKGKTIQEAKKITPKDIVGKLGDYQEKKSIVRF